MCINSLLHFQYERKANLTRFEGSSSISSEDYFGGDSRRSASASSYAAPNLYDIKEGVRDGVTKVAGRLSSIANGVMSSLQVKYILLCNIIRMFGFSVM